MDLSIGLLGVLGIVGYNFRSKRTHEKEKRTHVSPHSTPNGVSVYESKDYLKVKNMEQNTLDDFHKKSIVVKGTNRFVTSSGTGNQVKERSPILQKVRFTGPHDTIEDDSPTMIHAGPMFNTGMRSYEDGTQKPFRENFTPMAGVSELSGARTDMTHQNMTPFFGSHPNTVMDNNTSTVFAKHVGEKIPSKRETFQVANGPVDNVFGAPLARPELERYVASNKQTNELPFDQLKVQPIPQEYMRILPRNVDELRTGSNNKKYTYGGRVNHGAKEHRRGFVGVVAKNQPDTDYENDPGRYFVTRAAIPEKPSVVNYEEAYKSTVNKELASSTPNLGPGVNTGLGTRVGVSVDDDGKSTIYQRDTKNTFANDWVRNHVGEVRRDADAQKSYRAVGQERETTTRQDLIGVKGQEAMYRGLADSAKTTNKENTLFTYSGNVESATIHVPENRAQFSNAELRNQETREYIPGGVLARGIGSESVNITQRNTVGPNDHFGGAGTLIPGNQLMGQTTLKNNGSEHDFGHRLF